MSRMLSWLITLLIALLAVTFAVANRAPVAVSFWPTDLSVTLPVGAVLVGMLLFGMLVGHALNAPSHFARKLQVRRLKRDLDAMRDRAAPVVTPVATETPAAPRPFHPALRSRFFFRSRHP